jgi:hypothetical protein
MILSFPFVAASFDADARAFINTSGATARAELNHFVKGIKKLNLYSSMVCWPLRSTQNAGTGSTAYSLGGLGTYNGTLVNGPTWGADGVVFVRTSSQYINAPTATASPSSYLLGAVFNPSTSGTDPTSITISHNGTSNADAFQIGDSSSNILTGGHRQVAGSTFISPANQTYTTGSFQFAQQGWDGATVRRFFNKSSQVTSASNAFGGFISPLRINARGDSVSQFGNNKTTSFAFMTHGSGASATISNSIFDLYKSTLGQGLSLP